MSNFKIKHGKTKNTVQIITLDETHKKMMEHFQSNRNLLPDKKKKLEELNKELDYIEKRDPRRYTTEDIRKRSNLKLEINKITEEIYDIENDVSELDYYCKTQDIIMDYYQLLNNDDDDLLYDEHPELCERKSDNVDTQNKEISKLDILNNLNKDKRKVKKTVKRRKKNMLEPNNNNILNFFSPTPVQIIVANKDAQPTLNNYDNKEDDSTDTNNSTPNNKSMLMDQYMMLTDNEYLCENRKNKNKIKKCSVCNIEKTIIHSEGIYECLQCGEFEMIIIDSEKPNYKEAVTDAKPGYPYKRINHLNEWLAQFQAKESIDIPDEIYKKIEAELKKNRITDYKKISLIQMKNILKKLELQQYYEHTTFIISKLSRMPPPTINKETEEKIRLMFKKIQLPFQKYRPKTRTNFLSYSYVLHKFFQLLGLDDFLKYFSLLKSREKLKDQDTIWEKICNDLNWEYIPSI